MSEYTAPGQKQYAADANTVALMSGSTSAGGMRGIGLIVFILGQIMLQKKSLDLAKDYYKTNKVDYDFFTSTHQAPMQQSAQEAFNPAANPAYIHDKYVSAPAAAARTAGIDREWLQARRSLSRYATGAGQRLDYEYAKHRAQQMTANWYLGWRNELVYAQDRNERRFNRKVMITNVGVGAGNAVAQGLATAASNLGNAYAGLGNQFGSVAQGISGENGRKHGIADTQNTYKQTTGR